MCVAARKDGKKVVTELWVDNSLDLGQLADADRVLYAPVRDSSGIPGSASLNICLTGYQKNGREDIMKMASLMGANFSKSLKANEATHLICYKFEGEKYEVAKQVHIKCVNHRWLEDCLKSWEILPIDNYTKSGWEVEIMEAQAEDSEDETEYAGRNSSSNRRISRSTPITAIRMRSHVDSDINGPIRGPTVSTSNAESATGRHLSTPEQIRKADVNTKSVDISTDSGSAPNTNGVAISVDHDAQELSHPRICPTESDKAPTDLVCRDEAKDDHKRSPDTRASALSTPSVHKSTAPAIPVDNRANIDGNCLHNSNQINVNNVLWSKPSEENCSKKVPHSSEMNRKVDQKDDGRITDLKPTVHQSYDGEKITLCESNLRSEGNSSSRNNQILGYSRRRSLKSVSPEGDSISIYQTTSPQSFEGNTSRVELNTPPKKNDQDFSDLAGAQSLQEHEVIKHVDGSRGALAQKTKNILSSASSKPPNGAAGSGTGLVNSHFSSKDPSEGAVSDLGRSSAESAKGDGHINSGSTVNFTEKQMPGSFKSNLLSNRRTSLKLASSAEVEKVSENPANDKNMGPVGKVTATALHGATTEKGSAICPSVNSEVRKESSGVSLRNKDTEMSDAQLVNKIEVAAPNSEPDKMVSHQNLESDPKEIPVDTITYEYRTSPPKVSTSRARNAGARRIRNAGNKAAAELVNNKSEVATSKPMHAKVVSHENVVTQQGEKYSRPNAAECTPLFPEEILNSKSRNEVGSTSAAPTGKVNASLAVSMAEFVNVIPQKNMKENRKRLPSSARADENQGNSSQKVRNSVARNLVAKGSRNADAKMADSLNVDKTETMSLKSKLNVVLPPENGEDYPKMLSSSASADDPETCTADQVPNNKVRKVVAKRKVSAVQNKSDSEPCKKASVFVSEDKVVSSERGAQSSRNAGMVTMDQDLQNTNEDRTDNAVGSFCKNAMEDRSKDMQSSKSRSSKKHKIADSVDGSMDHDKENILISSNSISKTKYVNNRVCSKSFTKALQNSKDVLDERSVIKGRDCGTLNVLEPTWFILSGHRLLRKEYKSILRRLKGRVCRDSHHWSFQATHLIATELRRTEKFFAAAAAGRWILKPDYLTACNEAGKFLDEEPFEWHGHGLNSGDTISLDAPRKWRHLRQCTGRGAFYGMQIIIYGECIAPTLDTLKRTIRSGDGTILATSPPYTRFLKSGGVDFAVVSAGIPSVDAWVQEFMRHNIPCISADYLVEYVCKPGHPLTKHVLFNMHDQAKKSLQKLQKNQQDVNGAETGDAVEGGDTSVSCSACGSDNREGLMLVCGSDGNQAGCGVRVHGDCCNPPVAAAPDSGEWLCPKCDIQKPSKKAKKSAKSRVLKCR
uniref:BRCT domain-containing protein n=1 Tax=Arundo donax TaxID=35708 RepID=A0A0A9B8S3_ARUDO